MTGEESRPILWGSMIPLVGGSALGCSLAASCPPLYNLSYTPFSNNEAHLKKHWQGQEAPWHYLDKEDCSLTYPDLRPTQMDFINSVCPCAGLSMLNNSKGKAGRGACAEQNKWMLDSAEFVLYTIKPKVTLGSLSYSLTFLTHPIVSNINAGFSY